VGSDGHHHRRAERIELARVISSLLDSAGLDVAVAESLTGGMVASALAEAPRVEQLVSGPTAFGGYCGPT